MFSMQRDLSQALNDHFGFSEFRPGQREVMESLIAGRSAVAVFPTGSGKSLCYQLTSLLLEGLTLVVSPLIALMKDQVDALAKRGINARRLDSTLSAEEYQELMAELRSGKLRMLFVAPERFNNERFRESIASLKISLFAIDEAHCISEWGHNFRPDYLKLVEFSKQCKAERILALTATATEKVLSDLRKAFGVREEDVICTGFYRENLTLKATPVTSEERKAFLIERLTSRDRGPTIVYVTQQKTAEAVADLLSKAGFPATPYHAGMKSEDREAVQNWFLDSQDGIVVATIAFGMGVDKPNIRYVYHYNIPKSLENYAQEIGRSGRDGLPSVCETLICMEDLNILENFAYGDTPTRSAVRSLVRDVFSQGDVFDVSYYELSSAHDIRLLVVRTLMTYLELLKFLEGGTPFYSEYRFQPLMSSEKILAKFQGEKRQFLQDLFRQAKKAKTWFDIDLNRAASALNCPRERIVTALDYLAEKQMLSVKAQGLRNRYRRLKPCEDLNLLADKLHAKLVECEQRDLERLHHLLQMVSSDACYWQSLSQYFGEPRSETCGHCGWCLDGNRPVTIPERLPAPLEANVLAQLEILRRKHPVLKEPALAARFLCGVTSPRLTAGKLSSDPLFGVATHVPYAEVLSAVGPHPHDSSEHSAGGLSLTEHEQTLVRRFIRDLGGPDRARLALDLFDGPISGPET